MSTPESASSTIHPPVAAAGVPRAAAAGSGQRRLVGAAVAVVALAVLFVAARLEPSPDGLGTHRQIIGLPPCGWIFMFDCPCPTCGMTTAFAHAADGRLLRALHAQPFGALLALASAMALLAGAHVAATGSHLARILRRLWIRGSGWLLAGMLVAAWLYKIASYKGWLP